MEPLPGTYRYQPAQRLVFEKKIPRRIFYVSRLASVTSASSGDHPLDRCSFRHILISGEERTIAGNFLNRLWLFDSFEGQ